MICDDRVSGHVRFGPFSEHRFDVLPERGGDIEGIWQSGLKMGAAAKRFENEIDSKIRKYN
ncbi:hypothetical protein [Lachnoclostridium sp. An14]|uniref:hypothetical protein n=1 Tax=Lachnoclostridium sp. An14 TaxID=1965562 RepID=UPI00117A69DE|nr:hypothetical protein [Lachnoclostridium sp. An14]